MLRVQTSTYTVTACGLQFNNGTDGKGAKTVITKSNSQTDSCQYLISYTFSNWQGRPTLHAAMWFTQTGKAGAIPSYSPWTNVTLAKMKEKQYEETEIYQPEAEVVHFHLMDGDLYTLSGSKNSETGRRQRPL